MSSDNEQPTGAPSDGPEPGTKVAGKRTIGAAFHELIEPFRALAETSRSLLGVYVSYVLEGMVYFGILTILGKYLSENVGLKDLHAGWVYSILTGGITFSMLFLGGVSDRIGIRRALLYSLSALALGRLFLGASSSFFVQGQGAGSAMFLVVALGLLFVVLGYGMYQPASYAAVKQFTDEKQATMGYAMIYGLMNLGAFFSGILSPPVRQKLGIGAVFWVYFGAVVVALLALYFIMTAKAVARNTVTDISEKKKSPEDKAAPPVAPQTPLFTPAYIALIAGFAAALIGVITLAILADPGPAAESLDVVKGHLRGASKVLAVPARKRTEAGLREAKLVEGLVRQRDALREASRKVVAPATRSEGTVVDQGTFQILRALVQADADFVDAVAKDVHVLVAPTLVGSKEAKALRKELRAAGVYYLAVAYRLVGKFDRDVLGRIQKRQSTPQEDRIPLPDPQVTRILAVTDLGLAAMFGALAQDTDGLADRAEQALGAGGGAFARVLRSEAALLRRIVLVAAVRWPESLKGLLVQHCYQFGTLLIKELAPTLDGKKGEVKPVALDILAARLGSSEVLVEHMKSAADAAVQVPLAERLQRWGLRYGVLLFVVVFFAIFAVVILLKRRPDHPFHDGRFVFFIFALIPVQTLFAHNWLTLPYYIDRAFGGTYVGANFEFFSNINPVLIFLLTPFVAALTARRAVYTMMIWGTFVMAVPTFLLLLPPSPTLLLTYILLMSIGEAMWQPRFLQWVAEIAPEGKTGAYMGIAQFPWFLTKVVTGLYSGYFLAKYCPLVGPQSTETLWLIYALTAMVSPIALVVARGWMAQGMRSKARG